MGIAWKGYIEPITPDQVARGVEKKKTHLRHLTPYPCDVEKIQGHRGAALFFTSSSGHPTRGLSHSAAGTSCSYWALLEFPTHKS